jgi:hypothetical protein
MYSIVIDGTASPAAAFDAFEIKSTTGIGFIVHEIVIAQSSDTDSEQLGVTIKRAASTYTSGSGGTSPTPAKLNSADAAAAITAEVMNTTQAVVGTGSLTTMKSDAFNVLSGWHYLPTPECRPVFPVSEACVVSISAPADAVTVRGYAVIEETP